MFGFAIGTSDGIKLGLIENNDMGSLLVYYEISRNTKLNGLLDRIS